MTDETATRMPAQTDQPPDDPPPQAAAPSSEEIERTTTETEATGMALDGIGAPISEGYTDAVFAEMTAAYPEETGALRQAWGEDAAANTAFARRALEQIETASPGLVAELSSHVAIASPKALAALATLGRTLAATPGDPDSVRLDRAMAEAFNAPPARAGTQKQGLQGEIDRITAQAWEDGAYYSTAVQDQLRPLYERLHGTARVSGPQI